MGQKGVSSMSTEDNKAIARRLYEEAWNKGTIAAVDELVAPNIVLHYDYPADIPGPAENQLRLEEIKQFVSQLRTTFPDYHFTVVNGKIAESWINEDALGRLQQIGVLPTPWQAS
jgi:hypothetical protein